MALLGATALMAQQPDVKTATTNTAKDDTTVVTIINGTHYNEDSLTHYLTNTIQQVVSLVDSVKGERQSTCGSGDGCGRHHAYVETSFKFYWGFHNWGDKMMNGLGGMDDAYSIRTSFSNYQLELMANLNFCSHWQLGVGLAYESDAYKFRNNYVAISTGNAASSNNGFFYNAASGEIAGAENVTADLSDPTYWNTRLVARYINIPVRLGYNFSNGDVHIGFSVIPGFNYDGKHTGLKHKIDKDGYEHQSIDNTIEDYLNPFKCDLRLDVSKGGFGFFIQVPTMPVNTDMDVKLYPFKIGFFI